ncbi:LysR family transcriptional regulator [Massilia cavernae]|uniref:LysR family transcriptional regulator n=1 Tax=Massilia cavernae TaxID=2320864 RepID=A0A418X6Y2_9BURK|nr:LysR family transcriptional regulator [Massilia cavernae]RJG08211.1 LysR family transcriptional regulator [Massilia cavernae]
MAQYDLVSLRSFITVVECGSFVRAAEQLGASTAAISRHVATLERALDTQLISRTTRRSDLTEAGRRFYEDLQSVFQLLGAAEERVRVGRESVTGLLRVAVPLSFGIARMAPLLPAFMRRHPDLKIELLLEDRYTDLQAEGIDVAIRIGSLRDSSLVATRIGTVARLFCAAPAYLMEKGEPQHPVDLQGHSCLHYSLLSVREEWSVAFDGTGHTPQINGPLSANNAEVLAECAIQGMGIVLLPRFVVAQALADGRLREVLTAYNPDPFGLYAVRISRQFTPARLRLFIAYMRESFQDALL